MPYDPEKHHRRSIRLKNYDYSKNGAYFITICCQNRECLFGKIENSAIILNDAGEMVQRIWNEIQTYYKGIDIDAFQIMPNHIHGIIFIIDVIPVGAGPRACPKTDRVRPDNCCREKEQHHRGQPQGVAPTKLSLSDCVHRFKTITTKRYIDAVKNNSWKPFKGRLWQRNFYDHILRDENELNRIREYIRYNPMRWEEDEYYGDK